MRFVAAKSAPTISSVNDCTGSDFETSRIAQTGNEKSSSIVVRACSETLCIQGQSSLMSFSPVSTEAASALQKWSGHCN